MSKQNIPSIAGKIISEKGIVSTMDVFIAIGWLTPEKLSDWRKGRVPYLERVITASLGKISKAMKELRAWAIHSNLKPSITVYKHNGNRLRFSKTGEANIETAYSTHYLLIRKTAEAKQPD
ncbi:MAG: hypothetical protein A3F12_07785 [Gammaproteobacteria bacterium RIFCSPHIGHO2_12_FULL_38_14]|nr:MAG: hypothetical protein A3F12_07785 [Gammaproteobacteria bacterium RIFCSPHIGHO2_12_FULL_38_14]